MTREEAKTVFLNRGYVEVEGRTEYDVDKWRESCRIISDWLEQQSCFDCVSRQAVLELVADYDLSMGQVVKGIHALPPVTPQSKIEKWTIPFLMHKEMDIPILECQKAYDVAIDYLRNQGRLKG